MLITEEAKRAMRLAARYNTALEVGGFAATEKRGDLIVVTGPLLIYPQVVKPAFTDGKASPMGNDAIDWLTTEMAKREQSILDNRCWWHSHRTMATSPSGTDEETMRALAEWAGDWFAGVVISTDNTKWTAFAHMLQPFDLSIKGFTILEEADEADDELKRTIYDMMDANVVEYKEPPRGATPSVPTAGGGATKSTGTPSSQTRLFTPSVEDDVSNLDDDEFIAHVEEMIEKVML